MRRLMLYWRFLMQIFVPIGWFSKGLKLPAVFKYSEISSCLIVLVFSQNGENEWSDGNPVNFHMLDTDRSSSIEIYQDILKYFWFLQLYGQDSSCRFDSWDKSACLRKHDKIDFCGFSEWNTRFCFDSYKISMRKLSHIANLVKQSNGRNDGRQCTLMVVLYPYVRDIMWLSIPCDEKILENATIYCTKKDSRYYNNFKKASPSPKSLNNFNEILYKCKDSSFISKYFLFDEKQDCIENENETVNHLKRWTSPSQLCDVITHLNLEISIKICLPITPFSFLDNRRIPKLQENNHCLYILNRSATLIPHNNGRHLTKCETHQCDHTYYKCPGFYCIPWQYVCNQRVDCPGGLDERQCDRQQCTHAGQLMCRNTATCVALENVCDGVDDCPLQEDEYFCDTFPSKCPLNCICLLFNTSQDVKNPQDLPYHDIWSQRLLKTNVRWSRLPRFYDEAI